MKWLLLFLIIASISTSMAYAQEPGLATYQEIAQILVDKTVSQSVTSSITLQSTSVQELTIPLELEQKIRADDRISAIILTNEDSCVLGVRNEACLMINVERDPDDTNFPAIQESSREASSLYIDELNEAFDTNAQFHSVFIHTVDTTNELLETSGVVSGRGTISAVYTMPMESTDSMYAKISSLLLAKPIRESAGFYDIARNLSLQEESKMTFSLIPLENSSLLQLRTTLKYPDIATDLTSIDPLNYLHTEELKRSEYFSAGFYPLNSLLQVVILSSDHMNISNVQSDILETRDVEGELIPTDISTAGWIFDPQEGEKIQGKWIFGTKERVDASTVTFSLGGADLEESDMKFDESTIIAIIIAIIAAVAAAFYLKGYKSQK